MEVCSITQYTFNEIEAIASNFTATLDEDVINDLLEIKKNNRFIRRKTPVRMKYVIADSWRVSGKDSEEITDDVKFTNSITSNLNKLSGKNADVISNEIMNLFKTLPDQDTNIFLDIVFEKALEEKFYSDTYAQLVGTIFNSTDVLSKDYLLSKCNTFYNEKIESVVDKLKKSADTNYDELCAIFSTKAEFIGGFVFISNLFNYDIVDYDLVNKYYSGLKEYALSVPEDDIGIYVDSIVSILTNCGKKLQDFNPEKFNENFLDICDKLIADRSRVKAKYRFKLTDILDLAKNNFVKANDGWTRV
jgi:hypothetical protein